MSYIPQMIPNFISAPNKTNLQESVFDYIPIWSYKITQKAKNELHWHNYTQIWYTISGSYYHTVNGERILQTAGDVSFIYPYTLHAVDTSECDLENTEVITVYLSDEFIAKQKLPFYPLTFERSVFTNTILGNFVHLSGKDKKIADNSFRRILSELAKEEKMDISEIEKEIISFFEVCISKKQETLCEAELKAELSVTQNIVNATNYLSRNLERKFSLPEISTIALMSERSFTDKFKEVTGQTYHTYLTLSRLSEAVLLMRYSQKNMSEIAKECGFSNSGHLTKVCNAILGISPFAMRKQIKGWSQEYGGRLFDENIRRVRWLIPEKTDYDIFIRRMIATGEFIL